MKIQNTIELNWSDPPSSTNGVSWEGIDEVQSILLMKAFNYKTQQESRELMA